MDENNKRPEGSRMFLLAFLLTLAALATVMVVTVMAVQPTMPITPGVTSEPYRYRPPAADTLTLVVIGEGKSGASDFLLLRFNPQYGQIPLTLLPQNTAVTLDSEPTTLAGAYAKAGGRGVKTALEERMGILVDRYAVISGSSFVRIAAKTGTVHFTLPEDFSYDRDGYAVKLPAGDRRLDGQDVLDLFQSPVLQHDPLRKSELLGELCAAVINQNMSVASDSMSSGIFRMAINLIKTDLSAADYEPRRESMHFLTTLQAQLAASLPPTGSMNQNGTFELSQEYIDLVARYFQPALPSVSSEMNDL